MKLKQPKETMNKYKIIAWDNFEGQYITTNINANNEEEAKEEVEDLPINDLFFKFHNKKPIWEIKAMVKALSQPISSFLNTDEDNKRLENCKIILNQPTRK